MELDIHKVQRVVVTPMDSGAHPDTSWRYIQIYTPEGKAIQIVLFGVNGAGIKIEMEDEE